MDSTPAGSDNSSPTSANQSCLGSPFHRADPRLEPRRGPGGPATDPDSSGPVNPGSRRFRAGAAGVYRGPVAAPDPDQVHTPGQFAAALNALRGELSYKAL